MAKHASIASLAISLLLSPVGVGGAGGIFAPFGGFFSVPSSISSGFSVSFGVYTN
jgi:hypothetical protein